ncbi:MAG TPA: BamA/TamA family outer membrane protein [Steroidobacteraceae bacterium]|nr:BamA/TamA family outer membrane protein [Steroidobacteraceae bacterium]
MGRVWFAVIVASCACAAPALGDEPQQQPSSGISRWFDPATAPFIPVPAIDIDPNSGTTLGIIPVYLVTDEGGDIKRIYAPDIVYNQYFGWGADGRILGYPSENTQWSVVGGFMQRVESNFDAQYTTGRLREDPWSFFVEATYDRSGTARFYGLGNESRVFDQAVYTNQQEYFIAQLGWNINRHWQLAYRTNPSKVEITPGNLGTIPPIGHRFPGLLGLGVTHSFLNRLQLTYDTRDDLTVPTRGVAVTAYGGVASRNGGINNSLYSEAGVDARGYWSPNPSLTFAAHTAFSYLPTTHRTPFWALSSIGGDESILGGDQPLRGFGVGRYYDRNSFSLSLEMRKRVASFDAVSTHIDLQVTPFIDTGSVFAHANAPETFEALHKVFGLGIRGVARPFVVGYIDAGIGSEGVAIFTGLNYPF